MKHSNLWPSLSSPSLSSRCPVPPRPRRRPDRAAQRAGSSGGSSASSQGGTRRRIGRHLINLPRQRSSRWDTQHDGARRCDRWMSSSNAGGSSQTGGVPPTAEPALGDARLARAAPTGAGGVTSMGGSAASGDRPDRAAQAGEAARGVGRPKESRSRARGAGRRWGALIKPVPTIFPVLKAERLHHRYPDRLR